MEKKRNHKVVWILVTLLSVLVLCCCIGCQLDNTDNNQEDFSLNHEHNHEAPVEPSAVDVVYPVTEEDFIDLPELPAETQTVINDYINEHWNSDKEKTDSAEELLLTADEVRNIDDLYFCIIRQGENQDDIFRAGRVLSEVKRENLGLAEDEKVPVRAFYKHNDYVMVVTSSVSENTLDEIMPIFEYMSKIYRGVDGAIFSEVLEYLTYSPD